MGGPPHSSWRGKESDGQDIVSVVPVNIVAMGLTLVP